ncbi:LysR family transcriptional regulator [Allorhizocola rhizosphaerae]|uniref:LysR family transcriptional regulator n=1 Tax=Allorhizocola rhizosphaerae TaxID=1872709 RepID=UPI000E3C5F45|nr:LysR substrate-binding domain-containing protein [Allorhizocola rhizosphaerae]
MIDMQRLRVLSEVARHGSFSKAAQALLFTPSAVSQQIAALERTLGTPVVDRSTRGVVLTEPGRLLVEAAETISAELLHAQAQIERLSRGHTGRLTIATFTSGGQYLLPAALGRFTAQHPEIELTVLEHEPDESIQLVRQGKADIALAYRHSSDSGASPEKLRSGEAVLLRGGTRSRSDPRPTAAEKTGMQWTHLMDDPMWIVLPPGHRLSKRKRVRLADLAHERWVIGCVKTSDLLHRYAALAGIELNVACSGTDYSFAQSLVDAGLGICLVPSVALKKTANAVALEHPRPERHIGAVTMRRRHPQPQVEALLETLLGLCREHPVVLA